jgi:hypothetical protein
MKVGDDESNLRFNKKLVYVPLSLYVNDGADYIQGELTIPSTSPKSRTLIVFMHGGGNSGRDSQRNQNVAHILNENGFATLLSNLLTPGERE